MSDSATAKPTRELAAIMFSDIAGYTALIGRDEQLAMHALDAHRGTLRRLLPRFNGRLIGEIGDGTLCSFHSAIEAVNCAREVQALAEDNPELRLRIGIHLGDVVFTNNTVLGDGVNVASRIHGLAPPGGICISEHVYDAIRNKPGIHVRPLGKKRLKNVARRMRVFALLAPTTAENVLPSHDRGTTWRYAIGAAVLAIVIATGLFAYRSRIETALRERIPAARPTIATVAVLPFANLSASKDDEYFSDGMTDEIIGDLGKISGLQVAARTSSFMFKGQNEDVKKIANLLRVRNLLEGSVRRSADKLRIDVNLIDAGTGFSIWSERYDRDMADVFAIQSEVAQNVAEKLKVQLLASEKIRIEKRPTDNLDAYNLFLQASYYGAQSNEDSIGRATECLDGAIKRDPNFATAYAFLAMNYVWGADLSMATRPALSKAQELNNRALVLDQDLSPAHQAAGWILFYQWKWREAEREFKRALQLDPNDAAAHQAYGLELYALGRIQEAVTEMEKGRELDPLSVLHVVWLGDAYYAGRQYEGAIEYYRQAIAMAPDFLNAHLSLGFALFCKGDIAGALAEDEKAASISTDPMTLGTLGGTYAVVGRRADALKIIQRLDDQSTQRFVPAIAFVGIYFALGDKDRAFQYLDKAYQDQSTYLTGMRLPIWDGMRADPRFQAIYRKVGLPL